MMRIVLLIATNFAVVLLLSVVMKIAESVFGLRIGQNYTSLLIMASVMGFGGAFISLAMSKWLAKRSTGAYVITQPRNEVESWLLSTVQRQAKEAGIGMPEVAIFDTPEMNAFATGMNKDNALVAVSTGLLRGMDRREVEAVVGHEVSHVANGDMVTLTLIQGVMNTFVIFLARIIGSIVDGAMRGDRGRESGPGPFYFVTVMVLQVILGILAAIVVAWFSRFREFRADAGGAKLEGRDAMISALSRLGAQHGETHLPKEVAAFGISGPIGKLLASHPPIPERIAALQRAA